MTLSFLTENGPRRIGRGFAGLARAALLGLLAVPANAQDAAPASVPAPAQAAQTPAAYSTDVVTPVVSDPMLAPPPPAAGQINSWEEGLRLVRTRAPQYLAGVQRVRQAEARSRVALSGVLPVLTGEGTYTHQFFTEQETMGGETREAPTNDVFGLGATARVPIVDFRAWHGLKTGELNEQAARLGVSDERGQIALEVVRAMLSNLAAARVAQLNREGLRAALERLALASARQQFGRGTLLDVDRAQQDVAASRAELLSGDETLQQSREALGLLLGTHKPIGVDSALDLAAFERAVAGSCKLTQDLEQRPDIAAARARLEMAKRAVSDIELQYVPTLDLVSRLQHDTKVNAGPKTTWNVQGVLSVPLYDGGARYGQARENHALAEQARQTLAQTRLAALVELARAERAVGVTTAARDVALQQRDLARSIDERIRQGFAGGLGTSLDLVTSAQSLRQAENRLALLELEVGKARVGAVLARAECTY